MNTLTILVGNVNTYYDYTNLIEKLVWTGRKGAAPRTATVTFADSEGYGMDRVNADVSAGHLMQIFEAGNELFRGLIMTETNGNSRKLVVKAYDSLVRMTNNKNSFSYKKKRADQIFLDCCKQLGLTVGGADNTGKVLSEVAKSSSTYWDIVQEALSQTYKATGKRYYVYSEKGKVYLRRRTLPESYVVLDTSTNTVSYERTRSIYETRTRMKVVTSKNKVKKTWKNEALEAKIGVFQDIQSVDKDITKTELQQIVDTFAKEKAVVQEDYSWQGIGETGVIAGGVVRIANYPLSLYKDAYVEEDTHTWQKGSHTMKLKLTFAANIDDAG